SASAGPRGTENSAGYESGCRAEAQDPNSCYEMRSVWLRGRSLWRPDGHAVLLGGGHELLQVRRGVGRRRQLPPLGRLADLREELLLAARQVDHQDPDLRDGLEVLPRPLGDVEE